MLTGDSFEVGQSIYARDTDGTPGASGGEDGGVLGDFAFEAGSYFDAFATEAVFGIDVTIGNESETYYAGGPQMGAQVETQLSKIDPNLSLRMEFVYTDYLTADINGMDGVGQNSGNDSELTGSDSAGRIGVAYRF